MLLLLLAALGSMLGGVSALMIPTNESAVANAFHVFNAVHSAGRLWGSSVNHNGYGFIPAVVPRGTLLYHGARDEQIPSGFEWLAFEVEHAELFARSFTIQVPSEPHSDQTVDQRPLGGAHKTDQTGILRGVLQTYRAERDLMLLYFDGQSAGKTFMGTFDTQDFVLRGNRTEDWDLWHQENTRATQLCEMLQGWGYDGYLRMEIGVEAVICDFADTLKHVSNTRTYLDSDKLGGKGFGIYELARAASERFDGLGSDRLRLDFSSYVSGFFFPIPVASTDPERPDLIRLGAADEEQLRDVRSHVEKVMSGKRRFTVNWQHVVDLIVVRFAEKIGAMGSPDLPTIRFIRELEKATLAYVDAPEDPKTNISLPVAAVNRTEDALARCASHHLLPALLDVERFEREDELIYKSIETVISHLCYQLFAIRSLLLSVAPDERSGAHLIARDTQNADLERGVAQGRAMVRALMADLAWTVWKRPRPCPVGEVNFIAMWPMGAPRDHFEPGCRGYEYFDKLNMDYWYPPSYWVVPDPDPEGEEEKGEERDEEQ